MSNISEATEDRKTEKIEDGPTFLEKLEFTPDIKDKKQKTDKKIEVSQNMLNKI